MAVRGGERNGAGGQVGLISGPMVPQPQLRLSPNRSEFSDCLPAASQSWLELIGNHGLALLHTDRTVLDCNAIIV